MNRELKRLGPLLKEKKKRKQTMKQTNRTYLFYTREKERSMDPLCCGRGFSYLEYSFKFLKRI